MKGIWQETTPILGSSVVRWLSRKTIS